MAKELTPYIEGQLTTGRVKSKFILLVNSLDFSDYLATWNIEANSDFASQSATFTLINDGRFNTGGSNEVNIGDVVEFSDYFQGDNTEFKRFYGIVNQRPIHENATERTITLTCLDYISILQFLDIDLEVEGTKVEVTNEVLVPNYLDAPNDSLAQLFNFANDALVDNPPPIIIIRNRDTNLDDPQYDGYAILADNGQLKLGFPLNAKYNYDLIAKSYYFYVHGKYIEDILEEILTLADNYGNYLFGETSAADVITNHLTETFNNVEGKIGDILTPNLSSSNINIETTVTSDIGAGDTSIDVTSTTGFPTSGQGNINGDIFTWSGKTPTSLTGIPATGTYALQIHPSGAYVEYNADYSIGQVWYLRYSNLITTLTSGNFTIPGGIGVSYIDKRTGRIILDSAISIVAEVTCDVDYSFKTLQTTGIELNKISFRSREVENRLAAVSKLREYCAPNYTIRTIGNNKIWASYLSQKPIPDYTLQLTTDLNFMEDEDLYTRALFYGKNKNPTNIVLGGGVEFATTGESYTGLASNSELELLREEGNYYIYGSSLSGVGKITADIIKPIVYINDIPIDNTSHRVIAQKVAVQTTTKTETTQSSSGKCLPKGTPIDLEDGTTCPIDQIKLGDKIKGGLVLHISHTTFEVPQDLYEFIFKNNRIIISSYVHPFGEYPVKVRKIVNTTKETYDIYTDKGYYFVNGVKTLSTLCKNYSPKGIYYHSNKLLEKIGKFFNYIYPCKYCENKLLGCNCGGSGGSSEVTSHTYYYYKIKFPHNNIDSSQSIIFYDSVGTIIYTLAPNYEWMNYGEGIMAVPGNAQNTTVESVSTATYYVFYSTDNLIIDYEQAEFKISKSLLKYPDQSIVNATYEYFAIITAIKDIASVIDGRWDTQVQTEFYSEPPSGYNYSILDLGSIKEIQALDIVAGFFKPDKYRTYDIEFTSTLQYSVNGVNYYEISDKTRNFKLTGGESQSFEEADLGIGFQARYLKLILENVKKLDYKKGIWVVAFTELALYNNIVLKADVSLIPTTYATSAISIGNNIINVVSTEGFNDSGTSYIDNENGTFDGFTYTGKTNTTFTGVSGISTNHLIGTMVVLDVESDTTLYDYNTLLPKLGDRIYKKNLIDDNMLFTQTQLDRIAKSFLYEFEKNHTKIQVEILYSPHLLIGQTIRVINAYMNIDRNYFIESISENQGGFSVLLAYYP